MLNDTSREIELSKVTPTDDPLGFDELRSDIDRLTRLRDEDGEKRPARWGICVDQLERALASSMSKYELLRDRYALLKRSNSQLADEVAWLRDQCDDLYPTGSFEAREPGEPATRERRYDDRFKP